MSVGENGKISIVMPAYNAEKTVGAAVESVLAQTAQNWELIVIDDGSRDGTVALLEKYAAEDSRVRFLRNEQNKGVCYTRNRAIALAEGEWIAFLDSDDLWTPDKLEKQMALIRENPGITVCYCATAFVNDDGAPYGYVMEVPEKVDYRQLLRKNLIICSSVLIRAEVMKGIQMPSDRINEDYFVWLKVLRTGKIAMGVNEPLLIYRVCNQSRSSNRLKSALMLLRTYRASGFGILGACFLTLRYTFYSVGKRKRIYRSASHAQRPGG